MPIQLDRDRESAVVASLADHFAALGARYTEAEPSGAGPAADGELLRDGMRYAVEVKTSTQGRADRVIPLLSQAILQAQRHAADQKGTRPMAVLWIEQAPEALFARVVAFLDAYRPKAAVAIVTPDGVRLVRWNEDGPCDIAAPASSGLRAGARRLGAIRATALNAFNPFSDLNQWMLKVLLAPEIRAEWLNAPRHTYRSGTELAQAAGCSQMSASRLLQHLRQEGFLDEYSAGLRLVRRQELFRRWLAAALRRPLDMPMRFNVRAAVAQQLKALLQSDQVQTCLGLFAAADALGVGHVSGVPPYVYVPQLPVLAQDWNNPAWAQTSRHPDGPPDFILRQPLAPQATFKGAVNQGGALCADAIQVWLDVSSHPARGQEQADHIYATVLQPLVDQGNV
ncbi:RpiR family transcriptional regulator [Hydrogenophaga sp. R2]|uniref:RpiR family transcriptional regulator n=1 Tax=Hydrogenophaga sp. R2 TaxID=3132827 RepID=UPI003CFA3069